LSACSADFAMPFIEVGGGTDPMTCPSLIYSALNSAGVIESPAETDPVLLDSIISLLNIGAVPMPVLFIPISALSVLAMSSCSFHLGIA
jgi:hypothetical protein